MQKEKSRLISLHIPEPLHIWIRIFYVKALNWPVKRGRERYVICSSYYFSLPNGFIKEDDIKFIYKANGAILIWNKFRNKYC
jgi:hypothetical protein